MRKQVDQKGEQISGKSWLVPFGDWRYQGILWKDRLRI